jgi:uncharacterized protein (DUF608 family)
MRDHPSSCGCGPSGCGGASRRDFLKLAAAGTTGVLLEPWPAVAGPFAAADFEKLVPADKKLRPEWIKSLFDRGSRTVYRGPELEKIGMPVGGLCAGQLYLGGDGRLWHWDIFNRPYHTGAEHYARPLAPTAPLEQGFALLTAAGGKTQVRSLDSKGWQEIAFTGEYPIAFVEYRDPTAPVAVDLEAFSPFIPLRADDSSLPATVLRFTVRNTSAEKVEAELAGWLENAVCLHSGQKRDGQRRNRVVKRDRGTWLECTAEPLPESKTPTQRPDIVFDDFERATYDTWTTTGTAFGKGPIEKSRMPEYQGDVGGHGQRVVNSHATAPGNAVGPKDAETGTLTSQPFTIERNYINFLIGGGSHQGKTCVNLLVADKVVLSATGANDNRMKPHSWDVRRWAGQIARIQVVDDERGPWGNIGLDYILFSDRPHLPAGPLTEEFDFGTMGLMLLEPRPEDRAVAALPDLHVPAGLFSKDLSGADATAARPFGQKLLGALGRKLTLAPGQAASLTFVVAWHFPNLQLSEQHQLTGRFYATRFPSASAVAEYVAQHYDTLARQTRLWHDTWYDSTLPYWFLDRAFLNTSILATSTCYRFANGRFYGWEGVGCCAGTCGHVWQYAHAVARLFPELERDTRERVDFGLALQPNGAIFFRGEFNNIPAVDGQAGTILRALREHQVGPDGQWLKRNWPQIKRAVEWLISKDENGDGIITGNQHNTLDTDWFGPVAWLSGEYLAALLAAEQLAREMADDAFARRCRAIFDQGQKNLVAQLFDGEYFINRPDPKRADTINSGSGCHIDQVFGQSWAFQVGLGRVLPVKQTLAALQSLWRYNFTPDVGPYRAAHKPGRWYAMPGEGGLLMCTFPRADWNYDKAKGKGPDWAAGYFNECMNGFEYQVAGHMLWEGMVQEGLAITRMVHDRYHAARRNPWNEVECGDHYARSMASYGVFLAACGYEHHGPQGHLGFAPRLTPEDFRAPFTTCEAWGTFGQKRDGARQHETIAVKFGKLRVKTLAFELAEPSPATSAKVLVRGQPVPATVAQEGRRLVVTLQQAAVVQEQESLEVHVEKTR